MIKYYPDEPQKANNLFYSYQRVWSFGCKIIAVVGARGIGKSYGGKKIVCSRFMGKGEKFIWLRDTDTACEELSANDGKKFFEDLIETKEFGSDFKGNIKDNIISINGEYAGYLLPVSTFYNYKGNAYNDCKTIVFDECIEEKGQRKIGDRTLSFLNTIETIGRLRTDYNIILLANALKSSGGILGLFVPKIKEHGFYVNREKNFVLHYCANSPAYEKAKAESISGQIIKGTMYEENLLNNKFNVDNDIFFDKMPKKCRLNCIICDAVPFRIYVGDGKFYVKTDKGGRNNYRYVVNIENANTKCKVMKKEYVEKLKTAFSQSQMLFENAVVYEQFMSTVL